MSIKPSDRIPKGCYCYDENGICPYWGLLSKYNGRCEYLDKCDDDISGLLWDQGQFINKDGISLFVNDSEVSCIGRDIKKDLQQDKTVSQIKKEIIKTFDRIGVKVHVSDLDFMVERFGW